MRSNQILIDSRGNLSAHCTCCLGHRVDEGVWKCLFRGNRKIVGDYRLPRDCKSFVDERKISVDNVKRAMRGIDDGKKQRREAAQGTQVFSDAI